MSTKTCLSRPLRCPPTLISTGPQESEIKVEVGRDEAGQSRPLPLGGLKTAVSRPLGCSKAVFRDHLGVPGASKNIAVYRTGATLALEKSRKTRENPRKLEETRENSRSLEKTKITRENSDSRKLGNTREHSKELETTRESSRVLEKTVQRNSSRKLSRHHLTLHHTTLLHFTPCMYIHGFTLLYIYIYIFN